jgi:hypothetical protein
MSGFLDETDREILARTLEEFGVNPEDFWRFWSWDELQLDGDFKLQELKAFVKAMERMAERHERENGKKNGR